MKKVYLCGAIFGLADRGQEWRRYVIEKLPLLAPGWIAHNPDTVELGEVEPKQLVINDYADIITMDALIVRANAPSWGSAMEVSFASRYGVHVIAWDAPDPCSMWLQAHANTIHYRHPDNSLDTAIMELKHVGVHYKKLTDPYR